MDAIENEWESMDACLSHSQKQGGGHYHNWSPCIKKTGTLAVTGGALKAPGLCVDNADCKSGNVKDFSLAKGYTSKTLEYIALAKDGHMVAGPYNEKGELWTCEEVDLCNGTFLDSGSYVYASTAFFPYVLGCYGPAQDHSFKAKCSTTACEGSIALSAGAIASVLLASYLF